MWPGVHYVKKEDSPEDARFLDCEATSLGDCFQAFRKNLPLATRSFETSGPRARWRSNTFFSFIAELTLNVWKLTRTETSCVLEGFSWKLIFGYFRKSFEKNHVSLKSDKNDGYFIRRRVYIYNNSLNTSYNGKCFRQKVVEKITTSILCWIIFLSNSYLLWNNLESYDTADQAAEGNMTHALCLLDN